MSKERNKMNIKELMLDTLIQNKILRFGSFTTKSGRLSPYYFDFGQINNTQSLKNIAKIYATKIITLYGDKVDNILDHHIKEFL